MVGEKQDSARRKSTKFCRLLKAYPLTAGKEATCPGLELTVYRPSASAVENAGPILGWITPTAFKKEEDIYLWRSAFECNN